MNGIELSRAYFSDVIEPILSECFGELAYAAGRLGAGSDVLGLDDAVSRDHDWGLRLNLLVPKDAVDGVAAEVDRRLPAEFRGFPTRFAFTGETAARHHVEVASVSDFVGSRLGFDPRVRVSVGDWLSLSGQAVLEVTAGSVFVDRAGDLESVRRALTWYPEDVWRHVLACDWARISDELPLMGRAADAGDETGSRIIAARLGQITMHLGFMLERRWPPYAKWFGSAFRTLSLAGDLSAPIDRLITGTDAATRQNGIATALQILLQQQNALGLSDAGPATVPFWNRPYAQPNPAIAAQLLAPIADPEVRGLPLGRGSIEQRTDNVSVLVDAEARLAAIRD